MDPNANFGKIISAPPRSVYIPPIPIPVQVNNPYNFLEAMHIRGPNCLGNGGTAEEWNMIMFELEKADHPRIQKVWHIKRGVINGDSTTKDRDALSHAHSVLNWIKAGGDNVVCTKCHAKSDRFTNYVTTNGHPIDMDNIDYFRKRLLCKECYKNQKMEYETIRLMREKELQKKKAEEEERNKCSCVLPLSKCGNCIHKMREAYKNDPRASCEKCYSKNNTSVLKFGSHYHRTCDDCIQYFEADNGS